MCGRYASPDESAIEREFTLVGSRGPPMFTASFNVAPTQLAPYPDELRSAWPVSKRVNSPRNKDEKLISRSAA